jgi:DNA adenine methylase
VAVLMAKEPCAMETVNDLHGDLINLARCLQDKMLSVELYAKLNRTLMCEDFYLESAARIGTLQAEDARMPDIERAYDYFIYSWLGRNGVSGTKGMGWNSYSARFTSNGGHAAKRFISSVESIPAWHKRLQAVTILRRDGVEVLERIEDKEGTVIYCDPPYIVKGAEYVHDFEDGDHSRLAIACKRFERTKVVISYYDHPRLPALYPGWMKVTIDVTKSLSHQGKRGANNVRATEVLLVNRADNERLF